MAAAWYNIRELKFNREKKIFNLPAIQRKIVKDTIPWNQYFCCVNAHEDSENPCSVETICFFLDAFVCRLQ